MRYFQVSCILFVAAITLLNFEPIFTQDNFKSDGAQNFCRNVPSDDQIREYRDECRTCEILTRPLSEMRKCCDKPNRQDKISCLDELRQSELQLNSLFLTWKEDPEKEDRYLEHMKKCSKVYSDTFGHISCQDQKDPTCLDPIGYFNSKCPSTQQNSSACVNGWKITLKHNSLASLCVNDLPSRKDNVRYMVNTKYSTVHYRCFKEQALSKKYISLIDSQKELSENCLEEKYGSKEVNYKSFMEYELFRDAQLGPMWEDAIGKSQESIYEEPDKVAWAYLDLMCSTFTEFEHGQACIASPITQTYLTYQSHYNTLNQIKSCCASKRQPLSDDDKTSVKECLEEKHLYQQLYPLSGLYMRSLYREHTNLSIECQTKDMFKEGVMREFNYLNQTERSKYRLLSDFDQFDLAYEVNMQISPVNYHFFLRHFARETNINDDYYKAACEACELGEQLGLRAYVFPGLMCPALVSETLYEPIRMESDCPDKLFYKFQVAHYCCLAKATEKYNIGPNYNPNTCPDLSGVVIKEV